MPALAVGHVLLLRKRTSLSRQIAERNPKTFAAHVHFVYLFGRIPQKAQNKTREKSNKWWAKMCDKMECTRGFPDEDIIKLFLESEISNAEDIARYNSSMTWRAPAVEELENFLQRHLYWDPFYVRQKVLPLLSHLYLTELAAMKTSTSFTSQEKYLSGAYAPLCIHRIKIEQGEPLYMLKWKSMKEGVNGQQWLGSKLKPTFSTKNKRQRMGVTGGTDLEGVEFPNEDEAEEKEWCFTTDENVELIKVACPYLVEEFDKDQESKQAARTKRTKKEKMEDNESVKRQSNITAYFKQQKLSVRTVCEKSSMELLVSETPRSTATGPQSMDTESLVASLNSKSSSTMFSLVSPAPVPRTPRRVVSKRVARRLSLD